MVRILLFVTVLALGGGAFIAFSEVKGKIGDLETDLTSTQAELESAEGQRDIAKEAQKLAEQERNTEQDKAESAVAALINAHSVSLGDNSNSPMALRIRLKEN